VAGKDNLERRVTALEARARATESDGIAINQRLHALAGGQDVLLDLLRDHGRLLADHSRRFDRVEAKLVEHDIRLDRVEAKLVEHDARFDQVDARFDRVDARFDRVDARFEQVDGKLDMIVSWIQSRP